MIGSIVTALRSVMVLITVGSDTAVSAANSLHNVAKLAEAQSEQWLIESLEESDIKDFLTREPLRVRMEREEAEAKAARKALRLAAPKA